MEEQLRIKNEENLPFNAEKEKNREELRLRDLNNAKAELEKQRQEYAEEKAELLVKKDTWLRQAEENTLTDEFGQTIPIAQVKKPFGTRDENQDERKKRLKKIAEKRYNTLLKELDQRLKRAERAVSYYENEAVVGMLGQNDLHESFSEKRKDLLKKYLRQNASSDEGMNKEDWPEEKKKLFNQFLSGIKAYTSLEGRSAVHYHFELQDGNQKNDLIIDSSLRDNEIKVYKDIMSSLRALEKVSMGDTALRMLLTNYRSLLSGIADGDLVIPSNASVINIPSKIVHKDSDGEKEVVKTGSGKNEPLFVHEPVASDLVQGGIGDCYLLSKLAGFTEAEPQLIKNCMKDNGDGTVTVRLYRLNTDPTGDFIKTPMYFKVPKVHLVGKGNQGALWVNCIEMAFTRYMEIQRNKQDVLEELKDSIQSTEDFKEYLNEKKKANERFRKKKQKWNGVYTIETYHDIQKWDYISDMEKYIEAHPFLAGIYKSKLDKKQQKLNKELNIGAIEHIDGDPSFAMITGIQEKTTRFAYSRDLESINKLTWFMDDMTEGYMAEHRSEWSVIPDGNDPDYVPKNGSEAVEKLALRFLWHFFNQKKPLNISAEDEKSKTFDKILTMEQVEEELRNASDEIQKGMTDGSTLQHVFEYYGRLFTGKESDLYDKWKKKDHEFDNKILDKMKELCNYMLLHYSENRFYNYSRFTGKYTKKAMDAYKAILQGKKDRLVMHSGTYNLNSKAYEGVGQSDEHVFEGISSTHAYTILGAREEKVNGKTMYFIRVKNPWGGVDSRYEMQKDGTIKVVQDTSDVTWGESELELNDFMARFDSVTYGDWKAH